MKLADLILEEINTPTGMIGPLHGAYTRAMSGIGHAVLGASAFAALGLWGIVWAAIGAAVYWLLKERGDLRRGSDLWDGVEDAICLSLGAWYGPWWWPVAALAAAGIILVSAGVRARK